MSTLMTISLLLAMSRPARTDTVRYIFEPPKPVGVTLDNAVVVIDGEKQPDTFKWTRDIDMKNVRQMNVFNDSVTCATYGGRRATEEGLVFIITKKNSDLTVMPKVPAGSKPAMNSRFAAAGQADTKNPWSVQHTVQYDALPAFGDGTPRAFYRWMLNTVLLGSRDYMGDGATSRDYGPTEVSFIVTETGEVKDIRVLQERTDRFNAAVKALVGDSPAWKPAMKDGRTVPVVVVYPVNCFTLIR